MTVTLGALGWPCSVKISSNTVWSPVEWCPGSLRESASWPWGKTVLTLEQHRHRIHSLALLNFSGQM